MKSSLTKNTTSNMKNLAKIRDSLLSKYIIEINGWSRDKLINSLMDLKMQELDKAGSTKLITHLYASGRRK
jgi:hypothetical protein